jgi:Tol biopolymer transport system component
LVPRVVTLFGCVLLGAGIAVPERFAEGVITTAAPEFAITFTPDGRTAYFNRASTDRRTLSIMVSRLAEAAWQQPVLAPFSGKHRDVDPFVTPDGDRLYFSSDRPTSSSDNEPDFNTWYIDAKDGGWGEPQTLGEPLNSRGTDVFVSATRSGALYFSSNRDGATRTYRATAAKGGWSVTRPSFDINDAEGAGNPLIAPDESFLIFTSDHPGGAGGADLWITRREAGHWTSSRPLTSVNSPYADFAPGLHPDGRFLFFTSERPGVVGPVGSDARPPGDIYRIALADVGLPSRGERAAIVR